MGRFLCFPVNYNCLISFWKLKAVGWGVGAAWVSIVKRQLQDAPYSNELMQSALELAHNFQGRTVGEWVLYPPLI